ncbi:hypothetical protein BGX28_003784 [Mortierella sp. GBA30]|nr:hypothetical protein BGX28_003784 [Mortierella sp. GBA30]
MVALGRMPNLLDLEATWMNADLLEALIHLQKLERLSIARLQGSQPEGNPYFEPSFQGSKRIKELNMADSSQMTDSALVSITKTCPQIQVLTVSGNRCLTHEGLIRWCQQLSSTARHPPLSSQASPPYYYYSLNNPSLSIPKALQTKHEGMTELTTINFANCNRIQSEGFQALFECSHHLKHVNLMSTRVEDEALRVLSTRNLGLQSIILNCCAAISDQGLQMLLKFSRNLDSVSFLYCHRITVRVFFQTLWRCLGLKELRFSLNARHKDLIENGLELNGDPGQEQEDQGLSAASSVIAPSSKKLFHEAQLEFLIFGKPEADDIELSHAGANVVNSRGNGDDALALTDPHMDAAGMSSTSVQEYRQRLILAQIYRQIERLVCLQTLDMRDIHLPLDLDSGLARLGRLERLQVLELTGLDKPLGPAEVDWLVGVCDESSAYVSDKEVGQQHQTEVEVVQDVTKACELDNKHRHFHSLDTLVFKGGYSLSTPQLEKLRTSRPRLDVQLIQVKDHVS